MSERSVAAILCHFSTGVLDQVIVSGASFIAGFLMIRYTTDADYGQFVLAQSTLLLLVGAQGAWTAGPLAVIAPTKTEETRRTMVGSIKASQRRFLRRLTLAALLIPIAGSMAGIWGVPLALIIAATIFAGWAALERELLRNMLLVYSRPQSMLRADLFYVAALLVGIALSVFANLPSPGLCAVVTLALAGWAGATAANRSLARNPGWVSGDARPFWREFRQVGLWTTVGAVIYWLFAQSYNYVLATRLDLTAVANVNAARLMLMPVFVFILGVNNLLLPLVSNWLAEFGLRRLLRRLVLLTLVIAALTFVYMVPVWIFRRWLIQDLLHKVIGDRDRLLLLWSAVAVIFLMREMLQAPLIALKRVRSMTWLVAVSAAVSLSINWFGITRWGAAAVLIGQIAGECVNLSGLAWLLWRQARVASATSSML
jgi:O-antigen/teichoic acid export membrane protein